MRRVIVLAVVVVAVLALALMSSSGAFAASPGTAGQPSQTCLSSTAPMEPGGSASAPGSAFNENGGTAGSVYAGNGANTNTPANSSAVSQYDVACYQVSQSQP